MLNREGSYLVVMATACALLGAALVGAETDRSRGSRDPGGGSGVFVGPRTPASGSFVNFESAHVHPVDLTPDGSRLLVCNTADNRLEVFDLSTGTPVLVSEIPVGLDPVSVRARTNTEAWVTNTISDSVSIVSLSGRNVVATVNTRNEPSDVVFAGSPQRAFVSCSQAAVVEVFDPANVGAAPSDIAINGIDPRALAVSPDGSSVYCAIFNSGNASTVLGGGQATGGTLGFPPNVVSDPTGPYGNGTTTPNPPPNSGGAFNPPIAAANQSTVPPVSLIVKKDANGHWMDDNAHDWTAMVSGANASHSGRPAGWDMPDRDLAVINASSLSVGYAHGLMNICMAVGVNPASGAVSVVGTDATNEVRFEPIVSGTFVRVKLATVDPSTLGKSVVDLNPHLTYSTPTVVQTERDKSIGDPRGVVYNGAGTKAYITGMGSNNVIVVDAAGNRAGLAQTIPVGEGPTGLALDEVRSRLYVLNKFAASISVVSTASETVVATVPFFDPSPTAIKVGRKHLYDTHQTSGLGQAACASCHVDARWDRLAWDLGNPQGTIKQLTGQNLGAAVPGLNTGFQPWHPMKGPMTTQTLQDIIGHEPLHWRGDRAGLEEFNGAFMTLLGDDVQLTATEMQEFEDFLATITFPPNPYRNFDNTMPTDLALPGHYATGRFSLPAGTPLPVGHPNAGVTLYRDTTRLLDRGALACVTCHTLPTGTGPDATYSFQTQTFTPVPVGPNGEHHHMLVSQDGTTNVTIKVPQLRSAYLKVGMDFTQTENNAGFGFLHDGSVDSIARFVSEPVFNTASDQEVANLVAFILCFSGSDLPAGTNNNPLIGPGTASKDVPAAVGVQTTVTNGASVPPAQASLINSMISLAQAGKVGLVVKGVVAGEQRGFAYVSTSSSFQSDRASQVYTPAQLLALAAPGGELTYTVVPAGTQTRIGIDRDEDGTFDRDQADLACYANCDGSHAAPILNVSDFTCFLQKFAAGDPYANCDGSTAPPVLNVADFTCFLQKFAAGCP
jgi:YVTN family beta-propeller protein